MLARQKESRLIWKCSLYPWTSLTTILSLAHQCVPITNAYEVSSGNIKHSSNIIPIWTEFAKRIYKRSLVSNCRLDRVISDKIAQRYTTKFENIHHHIEKSSQSIAFEIRRICAFYSIVHFRTYSTTIKIELSKNDQKCPEESRIYANCRAGFARYMWMNVRLIAALVIWTSMKVLLFMFWFIGFFRNGERIL